MEVRTADATATNDADATLYNHYNPDRDNGGDHHHHHQTDHHGAGQYPPWLRPMLSTRFFVQCTRLHDDHNEGAGAATTAASASGTKATECNMFCLDCSAAMCPVCVPSHRRAGHRTVQIRRSSYHDVVRVGEIQRVLDVAGVQTYVINSARVVFLNERPQTKGGKGGGGGGGGGSGAANACEVCRRMLLDSFRFCSLGCKVAGTSKSKKRQDVRTKQLAFAESESEGGSCTTTDDHHRRRARSSGTSSDGDKPPHRFIVGALPDEPVPTRDPGGSTLSNSSTRKRRKGVPRRAPFG